MDELTWDAGDMGCGELIADLRRRFRDLPPGQRFYLIAQDPGAKEDLPAWCRMTGHTLIAAEHPHYTFQRKKE